jgi:hypothetical protein
VPGRVRCHRCGEIWPGLARFCGRCGAHLREVREHNALDPDAEDYTRSRRRLSRVIALAVVALVVVAVVTTGGGTEEAPPPTDPTMDPQMQ